MQHTGPAILLHIDCAGGILSAEVTRRSADMLGLEEGRAVTLLFKALSVGAGGLFQGV